MTLEQLLKLASYCELLPNPQGVEVVRKDNGRYIAHILGNLTEDGDRPWFSPSGNDNETPEGALDDLKNCVQREARRYAKSKHDKARMAFEEYKSITGEAVT